MKIITRLELSYTPNTVIEITKPAPDQVGEVVMTISSKGSTAKPVSISMSPREAKALSEVLS